MKTINYKALLAACLPLLIFSCKPEMVAPVASKGSVDATTYVAIGNSFSAGYADNALYNAGQQNSLPNLLAQQLKYIQGGNFKQPLMDAASVGFGASGNAHYVLAPATDCKGAISLSPVPAAPKGDLGFFTPVAGPFNNMSVPGAKVIYMFYPQYGNSSGNPFFGRMVSNPSNASMLSDAAAQNPTFFSYYGSDDFMSYALAGGATDAVTPSAGQPGVGFDASIDLIIGSLTANNAKGVIGNMPYVKSLPYFTTVPYNGLLLDDANATALTNAYSPLQIKFHAGYNGFIIADNNAPGGKRQIKEGELILLSIPQDSLKCGGWGTMVPIPNQYVLTTEELATINTATDAYNSKLKSAAATKGLAYVDVNAFMSHLNSGIVYNGVGISAQFVAGGAFSLDGIHLSPQGNALLTNEFIKAINSTYGSTIPQLNASMYKGVAFP